MKFTKRARARQRKIFQFNQESNHGRPLVIFFIRTFDKPLWRNVRHSSSSESFGGENFRFRLNGFRTSLVLTREWYRSFLFHFLSRDEASSNSDDESVPKNLLSSESSSLFCSRGRDRRLPLLLLLLDGFSKILVIAAHADDDEADVSWETL